MFLIESDLANAQAHPDATDVGLIPDLKVMRKRSVETSEEMIVVEGEVVTLAAITLAAKSARAR